MNFEARRQSILNQMAENSLLILYSGTPIHISADAYHHFEANKHFYYLTGLRRENMILVLRKSENGNQSMLYIEKSDPNAERWTGKMVTVEEAKSISGIDDVRFTASFQAQLDYLLGSSTLSTCYFDCYRHQQSDLPDYNLAKAQQFAAEHPGITVRNLWPMAAKLRMQKDEDEVALTEHAIDITDKALQRVLTTLEPGMKE